MINTKPHLEENTGVGHGRLLLALAPENLLSVSVQEGKKIGDGGRRSVKADKHPQRENTVHFVVI